MKIRVSAHKHPAKMARVKRKGIGLSLRGFIGTLFDEIELSLGHGDA